MNPFKLFGKKIEPKQSSNATGPAQTNVIGDAYESEYPMLPPFVAHLAVEGGFPFTGSLGPEYILDLRFFRALATTMTPSNLPGEEWEEEKEETARALAHDAYNFYLDFFMLPKEGAQEKAVEFWHKLLDA